MSKEIIKERPDSQSRISRQSPISILQCFDTPQYLFFITKIVTMVDKKLTHVALITLSLSCPLKQFCFPLKKLWRGKRSKSIYYALSLDFFLLNVVVSGTKQTFSGHRDGKYHFGVSPIKFWTSGSTGLY